MLVLKRRWNESIRIGAKVKVIVLSITPDYIELGIEAPPQVAVDREEIFLRKLKESATQKVLRADRI